MKFALEGKCLIINCIVNEFKTEYDELKDFKFFCFNGKVRFFKVDFSRFTKYHANCYDVNGVLMLFSETIFYPNFGFGEFEPKKWDLEIGKMLNFPIIKQMKVNCDSQFIREEGRLCT